MKRAWSHGNGAAIFTDNLTKENSLVFISNMQMHTGKGRGTRSNPSGSSDFEYKEIGLLDTKIGF